MAIWNERIHERRIDLGITLAQVASKLGVTEATAQRYESGNIKSIPYEHMCAYGKILNCSPAYLMGWSDSAILPSFSGKLKKLREDRNLSIKQLAEILNISQSSIAKYENGNFVPKMDTILNIAIYFDVSVDFLLGLDNISRYFEDKEEMNHNSREMRNYLIHYYNSMDRCGKNSLLKISASLKKLNETGQEEAEKRVKELAEIPRYSRLFIPKANKTQNTDVEFSEEIQPSSRPYFTNVEDAKNYLESLEDKPAAFGGLSTDDKILDIANDIKTIEMNRNHNE